MFGYWARRLMAIFEKKQEQSAKQIDEAQNTILNSKLQENMVCLYERFDSSADLIIRKFMIGKYDAVVVSLEGMVDKLNLAASVLDPIFETNMDSLMPDMIFEKISNKALATTDLIQVVTMEDFIDNIMSGFAGLLLDGCNIGLVFGIQGYESRSVSEPETEVTQRGSRESFIEVLNTNISLVRRRMKTPQLKFERLSVGKKSKTGVCLCYLRDMASPELVNGVRARLQSIPLDYVLESGYIQPFLEGAIPSLFTQVGVTERPDTVCGKIGEGRIAILIDGTPQALVVPHLFIEHFHSFDDYCIRPFYATFTRVLKFLAFFAAVLLPGLYVAVGTFHPELLPAMLLYKVANAESTTPFPLVFEALLIHFIYEVMREAGLRLPRTVGHAVSIVGALVIGDAAVTAGLIGSPMIIIVALTAVASFVVPTLYEPIAVLRFGMIILGGTLGLPGIMLAVCLLSVNICACNAYGIPQLAPISPFQKNDLRDVLIREGWKRMGKSTARIQNIYGSELPHNGREDE